MKKALFMAALVLVSAGCFAQKANVKKAKSILSQETPDYVQARQLMAEAVKDAETKDDVKTWYQAGMTCYSMLERKEEQMMLGKTWSEVEFGEAMAEAYNYFVKADEMAQVLVPNKKGVMVPTDPKMRKQVASKVVAIYNSNALFDYGANAFENNDFAHAYDIFMMMLNIPSLEMIQSDAKLAQKIAIDSLYYKRYYFAGIAAYRAENLEAAEKTFQKFNEDAVAAVATVEDQQKANEYLAQIYLDMKDSAKYEAQLRYGEQKFPRDTYFLMNIIDLYLKNNQYETAMAYLDKAIAGDPNDALFYYVKGNVLTNLGKYDEALEVLNIATEKDPKYAAAVASKGDVYIMQAEKLYEESMYFTGKELKEANEKMKSLYEQALPFFVQVHEMEPDNMDNTRRLRALYYRLGMEAEYNALSAEINK